LGKPRFDGWRVKEKRVRLRRVRVSHSEAVGCRTHDIKVK
jgi:hypothetical protein